MENLKAQYKPELYEKIRDNGYNYAKLIIPELKKLFPISTVLDIGCGGGSFLHGCSDLGISVFGVDGEHVKSSLQIKSNEFQVMNLEEKFDLEKKFDLAVSMEVGEHLDNKFSDNFVDSICKHADSILFSAAQPKQPGVHHINCQPLTFWIEKFEKHGYMLIEETTGWIRNNHEIYNWYRKNSMFFRRVI